MGILFDDSYLLLGKDFKIDENIIVKNPKLRDIFEFGEEKYMSLVSVFISTPFDYKVQLFDMGIDFETLNSFEFFFGLVKNISSEESKIFFGDLDFSKMKLCFDNLNQEKLLIAGDITINELSYNLITDFIRKINGIPIKKPEKYANEHAKQYRLEVERNALKASQRKLKEPFKSMLIPITSALVNHPGNPYDYNTIMDLSISQLYDSINRIQLIKNYDNVMRGLYSGTISSKDINFKDINWLA